MIGSPSATARLLANLLDRRGVGHTSQMQVGIDNFRGDSIVVGIKTSHARMFAEQRRTTRDMFRTIPVGLDQLELASGIRGAVAVDHAALSQLLHELVAVNMQLSSSLEGWQRRG